VRKTVVVTRPATPDTPEGNEHADFDAIVIGAGHNGLVTAAYLARSGMKTLLLEARGQVGGTAASEPFAGATVNICNCDHLTFRTTPVIDELGLSGHGLRYIDVEPAQHNMAWSGTGTTPSWSHHHDLDATLESLGEHYPGEVDNYRRYVAAARPAIEMVFAAAAEPPTLTGLAKLALGKRLAGTPTLLRWSRRSAADVLRSFFSADAITGPGAMTGPMVWGISPEFDGSGLGALTHAMRHVGTVGRPVGGSGQVTESLLAAFEAAGGVLRTKSPVASVRCEGSGVRGVTLLDGTEFEAPVIVSACNPHDTFLRWLNNPPAAAADLIRRWKEVPHAEGYESKIDAVLSAPPVLKDHDKPLGPTTVIAPPLADIDRGYHLMQRGEVLDRPGMLVNVPTLLDPTMAPDGQHVFSLEALFTPYGFTGADGKGWASPDLKGAEPQRWLEAFAELCEPGFLDSIIDWRAMTPAVYESDFHLPAGHATSFAGGPLAALRNPNPELTKYETAVDGLYLTGAATFPGAGVWGASGRNCATVILAKQS
jgi:beta-carotene ketolase (CrtO type)